MTVLRRIWVLMLLWVLCEASAATVVDTDSVMRCLNESLENKKFAIGECLGKLYVKQHTRLTKWNLGLNLIPGMTRFDSDESRYLTELFYDVHFLDYALPTIRRRAWLTTHRHGNGEMERVLAFMLPAVYDEKMLPGGYLSPLHGVNGGYYNYATDTLYSDTLKEHASSVKICFTQRFDNIKLFSKGWFVVDDSCRVREMCVEGWDEQCSFKVLYSMGSGADDALLVNSVTLRMKYKFAGNDLDVSARGVYDYEIINPLPDNHPYDKYNLTAAISSVPDPGTVADREDYAAKHRRLPLTLSEFAFYMKKGAVQRKSSPAEDNNSYDDSNENLLWTLGDQMISSHSLDWQGGNIKLSPIIDPSHLSYSSSRGLSYKMTANIRSKIGDGRELSVLPVAGYNFKQKALYWDVTGRYLYDPMNLGSFSVNIGSGNRTYSSVELKRIEQMAADSLDFDNMSLDYFKNMYAYLSLQREVSNGLEVLLGINFHRRKLIGAPHEVLNENKIRVKKIYSQFAPHLRISWQPGMYYYIKGGRKVNIGSHLPRISLDVEQGIKGLFGSNGIYTSSEIDIQYKLKVNRSDALYLRAGGGGFFYTKDVYFVDYAFLKHNYLPIDRSDELGGTFQLLASEWYNSANKYLRAHATYESPFLVMQRVFPYINFIKSERIYLNALVMSHLTPYTEIGYGISTPYVDVGLFISGKNHQFHQFGYKISVSLFED